MAAAADVTRWTAQIAASLSSLNAVLGEVVASLSTAVPPSPPPPPPVPPVVPPVVPPPPPPVIPPVVPPPVPPPPPSDDVTVTADWITTPHDKILNFGGRPTIAAVRSGLWSDLQVWSQSRLPSDADIVSIPAGIAVVYDLLSPPKLACVSVAGTLSFSSTFDTRLNVTTLVVLPPGALFVDTPAAKTEIVINDVPLSDAGQYSNGLIALGRVTLKGADKTPFVRLATEPKAGDKSLSLVAPVAGWKVGDRLVLPDSRQRYQYVTGDQFERPTVAVVSADGLTVMLAQPLLYDHLGARDGDGVLAFLPHVANLTRNVVIRSESANGVRGHCLFTNRADVDIRNVQFSGLGRTTNEPIGSANIAGRYSVHFHHLYGQLPTPAHGHQFRFDGNSVFCPLDPMPFRWGIAIHDSHYGLVKGNVLFNWAGAGIVTEQGNETGNVIESNIVLKTTGVYNRGDGRVNLSPPDYAHEGTGIWLASGGNRVRDNVISWATTYGFNIFTMGKGLAPAFPGADPHLAGQGVEVDPSRVPLLEFARNEVYGNTPMGLTVWAVGASYVDTWDIGQSVIEDFHVWHLHHLGIFFYPVNNFLIDGFVAIGDKATIENRLDAGGGINFGDYLSANVTIRNANIQNYGTGIRTPDKCGSFSSTGDSIQPTVIENCRLRNTINIYGTTPNAVTGGGVELPPRRVIVRDTIFQTPNARYVPWDAVANIYMDCRLGTSNNPNFVQLDEVLVYNFNRVAGDNFRVYYSEQVASQIVPMTGVNGAVGSPEAGLTNQQNWDRYGIAIGGAVAPATAVKRAGINGLVV